MFKKWLSIIFIGAIAMFGSLSFANPVSDEEGAVLTADEIIIAEPVTDHVFDDKDLYITVNIIDTDYFTTLFETPLNISLVKLEDTLPFADELGEDLNVPVVKLSSTSATTWLSTVGQTETNFNIVDDQYTTETEIINEYFKQLDKINTLNAAINAANTKYKFSSVIQSDSDLMSVSQEVKEAYVVYVNNQAKLAEARKAFALIQKQYLKLFEVVLLKDVIDSPSYMQDVGTLSVGSYRIRITDEEHIILKELKFEVVSREEALKAMISAPISVEDKIKN